LHHPARPAAVPRPSPPRSFVQHNCLSSLAGVENAPGLVTLNVSSNCLASLDGLGACPELASLVAEHNTLESPAALEALAACAALQTLDLQHNNISEPDALLGLLRRLPGLRCLYLKGNPVVGKLPGYRKALISALPALTYLDDRPVFEEERRCAEAWCAGRGGGVCVKRGGRKAARGAGSGLLAGGCDARSEAVKPLRERRTLRRTSPTLRGAGRAAAWRRSGRSASAAATRRRRGGAATLSGCKSCGAPAFARCGGVCVGVFACACSGDCFMAG
jgi:hypothetical protein